MPAKGPSKNRKKANQNQKRVDLSTQEITSKLTTGTIISKPMRVKKREEALNSEPEVRGKKKVRERTGEEPPEDVLRKKLPRKPTPKAPPEPLSDKGEDEDGDEDDTDGSDHNENTHLHGFSTDEDDSSDEDDTDNDPPAIDLTKLPTISKDDAVVRQKLEKAKRQPAKYRGVLYLSHIPHGFYEDQLKSYFSQFGDVTRLRLSRNKKTGRSKHYAFIEFDTVSVAKIVAETMDNYLLMGHILKCKVIPKEEVHPELWMGANRKWRVVPHDRIARVKHNKPRTGLERGKSEKRLLKRQNDRKRKLADAGIPYDMEDVQYKKYRAS